MKVGKDALNFDVTQLIVKITFEKSHSSYFNDAVQIAQELPSYESQGEGKEQKHSVTVPLTLDDLQLWERVRQLARIVGNWKKSEVEIHGAPVKSFWELERGISEVRNCYERRSKSGMAEMYCSGKEAPDDEKSCFGCRLVKGVSRERQSYSYSNLNWYQFGRLSDDLSTFHIDKDEIFRICKVRTGDHLCTTCPVFSWERVKSDIAELPDSLTLNKSSPFEVKYSEIDPSKALGVQPRRSQDRLSFALGFGNNGDAVEETPAKRNIPSVRYSDVAAQDKAIKEIKNVVQLPLTQPEYFVELGIEPQRGVILYGPPGNGKTLLAKAVASESNAHLEIINGPEVLSKWVGQSEENLRKVFRLAKELEPSIILMDEIDALAPNRDVVSHHHEVSLISQLLVLLDGLESRGRVVVIATTNRIEAIDPAIRRSGRFDYHIEVPLPDESGREAILNTYLNKMKSDSKLDTKQIAKQTEGFSGAELAALCREAGLAAIHRGMNKTIMPKQLMITQNDMCEALAAIKQKRYRDSGNGRK